MLKLFEGLEPGVESIETQVDDPVVEQCVNIISKLRSFHIAGTVRKYDRWFKGKESLKLIEELDDVLFKRFGIKMRHVAYDWNGRINYAVTPTSGTKNTTMNRDTEQILESIDWYLGDKSKDEILDYTEEVRLRKYDLLRSAQQYRNNADRLVADLDKGITVDWEKGRIDGVSEGVVLLLLADFTTLFRSKLTDREILSILFHEMGHAFTHIAYVYRLSYETSSFIEMTKTAVSIDDLAKKVRIQAKADDIELKSSNDVFAMVEYFSKLPDRVRSAKYNKHSASDSEHEADVFAARFGLGNDLAQSLNKLYKPDTSSGGVAVEFGGFLLELVVVFVVTTVVIFMYTVLFGATIGLAAMFSVSTATGAVLFYLIAALINIILHWTYSGNGESDETTYDNPQDRILRIKNDLVRQLRMGVEDKATVKNYISQIDNIVLIATKLKRSNRPAIFDAIGSVLPWNIPYAEYQKLEKKLEALSENDLHVAAARLETIK